MILTKYRILHEWSFHMKFMKRAFGEFHKIIWNDHECKILFIVWPFLMGFYRLQKEHFYYENALLTRTLSMTLRKRAKVSLHVWSYDFYDTTLSTE